MTENVSNPFAGKPQAGVYVTSQNGADWFYPQNGSKAYSLTLDWEDGTRTTHHGCVLR